GWEPAWRVGIPPSFREKLAHRNNAAAARTCARPARFWRLVPPRCRPYHRRSAAAVGPTRFPLPRKVAAMQLRTWSAGLAALCLLIAADAPQQQTTLRYKFKKGDRLPYAVEQKATVKFDLGGKDFGGAGQGLGAEYNFRLEWTISVLDVDAAGKARIECKLDRLRLKMS